MLYLIPEEQKKRILMSYYARIVQVGTWFLIGIFLVIGIASIPTILSLQTEVGTTEQKTAQLEEQISKAQAESTEADAILIAHKIEILKTQSEQDIRKRYIEISKVVQSVKGVTITSLTIDTLTKKIQIVTEVQNKDIAKDLVDALNKTTYTGATLPYSVLSEKSSFIFAQNLSYE